MAAAPSAAVTTSESSMNEKVAEQAQIRGLVVDDEHEPGVR